MKIKTLVAVLLLSGGVTSTFAQSDCNANSSISHEAVRANTRKRESSTAVLSVLEWVLRLFRNYYRQSIWRKIPQN